MSASSNASWLRRLLTLLAWACAALLVLSGLWCLWMNWSGARRWQAAQAMLAREGETLDFHQIASDPVPDAKNFCAIPLLSNLPLYQGPDGEAAAANRKRLDELALPTGEFNGHASGRPKAPSSASSGTSADLKEWAIWLRREGSLIVPPSSGNPARDVLTALAAHDAMVAELAAGLDRPEAQWTPSWSTRPMPEMFYVLSTPHCLSLGRAGQFLAFRATAAAQAGDAARAHESLLILLRLVRASLDEPLLISSVVGMTQAMLACNGVWELSRTHTGSVEDFRKLEQELRRLDMRTSVLHAFRGDMAGGAATMQWLKRSRDTDVMAMYGDGTLSGWTFTGLIHQIPSGWFDMNAAAIVELNHAYVIAPLRDRGLAACMEGQLELDELLRGQKERSYLHLDSIFARLALEFTGKMSTRAICSQDMLNQAIIACALERYYVAHQSYPETLSGLDLEGRPLPLDVLSGNALGYRTTPEGRYALWSVGFDREDDGGKRVLNEEHPEATKFYDIHYTGDWVWDFPQ